MADIALSNLDHFTRSSSRSSDLDHDDSTQNAGIDFDGESTSTFLPFSNPSPLDDNRRASFEVENLGYASSRTSTSHDSDQLHRRGTPRAFTQQGEPYQGVSSLTGEFATGGRGWWKQQMLVDRSLRSMAALTAIFALIMMAICLAYLPKFAGRPNPNSTSVGWRALSCKRLQGTDVRLLKIIHLLINIAATMMLGMSNTYQQLITSLKVDEIRWMLSKHEDSRVGTNSPMTINHKKDGKLGSWLAWLLLVSTSLPLHLLANSIIGPSIYIKPADNFQYHSVNSILNGSDIGPSNIEDSSCWTAFRSGYYFIETGSGHSLAGDYMASTQFTTLNITYFGQNCAQYRYQSTAAQDLIRNRALQDRSQSMLQIGDCAIKDIRCIGSGSEDPQCRLNIRMSAALTLTGCLLIKAIYMTAVNVLARKKIKTQCLTFGDVLAASAKESDLQRRNECLVNSGDGHRHQTQHTCHKKHCLKDSEPSLTGDDIGHCQKCESFNIVDKAADLPHPSIAIKYKKSLIANLGSTAVSQMMILMICSLVMLSISIILAVSMASSAVSLKEDCLNYDPESTRRQECDAGVYPSLKASFGTFGGFQSSGTLSALPADSLKSELLTFVISNGAQLLYSLLYLLLIYNITLISMERDWSSFEKQRRRPRCTLVKGDGFYQSYLLQLPKKVIYPMMAFSATMHWLLGQAISTIETIWVDPAHDLVPRREHSVYYIVYGPYSIWLSTILMVAMTVMCWRTFTYKREGFMPQMYGSIRTCCSATTELRDFPREGIQWGDLGMGERFRHAGFSSSRVDKIVAGEIYCGRGSSRSPESHVDQSLGHS